MVDVKQMREEDLFYPDDDLANADWPKRAHDDTLAGLEKLAAEESAGGPPPPEKLGPTGGLL